MQSAKSLSTLNQHCLCIFEYLFQYHVMGNFHFYNSGCRVEFHEITATPVYQLINRFRTVSVGETETILQDDMRTLPKPRRCDVCTAKGSDCPWPHLHQLNFWCSGSVCLRGDFVAFRTSAHQPKASMYSDCCVPCSPEAVAMSEEALQM